MHVQILLVRVFGFLFSHESRRADYTESVDNALPLETSPQDVKQSLDAGRRLFLIDVREPVEFELARIQGAELIPMRSVPSDLQRLEAWSDQGPLIVYCHHGVRSMNVVNWLREQGIAHCQSMAGGIDRWSREIDPSVPQYS